MKNNSAHDQGEMKEVMKNRYGHILRAEPTKILRILLDVYGIKVIMKKSQTTNKPSQILEVTIFLNSHVFKMK